MTNNPREIYIEGQSPELIWTTARDLRLGEQVLRKPEQGTVWALECDGTWASSSLLTSLGIP